MKNISIYSLLFYLAFAGSAHGQLTVTANGLIPGDTAMAAEVNFTDPGPAGDGMLWDFTRMVPSGKTFTLGTKTDPQFKAATPETEAILYCEGGYEYQYQYHDGKYVETGYINRAKRMTLALSDPIERLRLPLAFGQEIADSFAGVAWYNEKSRIDLSGRFTLKADARGTLVLPDRILPDVMRVTSVKNSLQIGVCGTTGVETRHYGWYAPGFRYPVVTMTETVYNYPGKEPVHQRSAYLSLSQPSGVSLPGRPVAKAPAGVTHTVTVSPNPFSDVLTYRYFVKSQTEVSIELFDMTGKRIATPAKSIMTDQGVYTGTLDAMEQRLTPGMYYLRFTFGNEVTVKKVVRL